MASTSGPFDEPGRPDEGLSSKNARPDKDFASKSLSSSGPPGHPDNVPRGPPAAVDQLPDTQEPKRQPAEAPGPALTDLAREVEATEERRRGMDEPKQQLEAELALVDGVAAENLALISTSAASSTKNRRLSTPNTIEFDQQQDARHLVETEAAIEQTDAQLEAMRGQQSALEAKRGERGGRGEGPSSPSSGPSF